MNYKALKILKENCKLALFLLNQPLRTDLLKLLWDKASIKIVADGAISRLQNALEEVEHYRYIPDYLVGDMDSSSRDIRQFYADQGTVMVEDASQETTDCFKCLSYISDVIKKDKDYECIVVLGAFGGRMDHTLSNINVLFKSMELFHCKPVYMFSDVDLAFLLRPKVSNEISVNSGLEGNCCGLLPVGQPCLNVATSGLKWNLDNQSLQFGGLISSSNTYSGEPVVKVITDQPLLWTMEYTL